MRTFLAQPRLPSLSTTLFGGRAPRYCGGIRAQEAVDREEIWPAPLKGPGKGAAAEGLGKGSARGICQGASKGEGVRPPRHRPWEGIRIKLLCFICYPSKQNMGVSQSKKTTDLNSTP